MSHFLNTGREDFPEPSLEDEPTCAIKQIGEFAPTDEQSAFLRAGLDTNENLIVNALAGAAKTSTIVMLANQPLMMKTASLCLAFNKKIADEMASRLPSVCVSLTLNALGHRVWSQSIGVRCRPSSKKNYTIFGEVVGKERKDLQTRLFENTSEHLKTIAFAKSCGYVPDSCARPGQKALMGDDEFFSHLPEQLLDFEEGIIRKCILESIERSYSGDIDFDDQIYMPSCFPSKFPQYPLTIIDEAQDLSSLNHHMLAQIVRQKRLIAVGDPCQAIYGFRGAHQNSMDLLKERFHMREFTLSTSFRCPKAVIDAAKWRAPHMNAPSWAKPGTVKELFRWGVEDLPSDAVIICRNNAPLFSCAIKLLIDGRYPTIVGRDIGKQILKTLKKISRDSSIPTVDVRNELQAEEIKRLSRARTHAKGGIKDFFQCLRIFCQHGDTLGDIIAYADHVINMEGTIKLMTGHKAKGLEFENVYILDKQLLDLDNDESQDRNLYYVMQTRSMNNLYYIELANFEPMHLEEETEDDA